MSSSIAAISTSDSDEARALQFEQEMKNKGPSAATTSSATSSKPSSPSSNNTKSNPARKSTSNEIKNQSKDNQNPTSSNSNHPSTSTATHTTSTRPTSSAIQQTSSNPTRSSARKSRPGEDKDQIKIDSKGKAPDVDRDGDVEMIQHPSKEISQKEQQTADQQQEVREGDDEEDEEQNLPNPRLDIMRLGLERFMTVIDAKVSPAAISSSLPSILPSTLEDARLQFIGELKSSILDELSKLEEELSLPKKLRELQILVEDSERRYEERLSKKRKLSNDKDKGKGKGKSGDVEGDADEEEDKEWDVWRKDLDIKTAIHARNIPDQKERIRKMEEELESLQSETTTLHQSLIKTNETISNRNSDANQALELLREIVEALQPPPSLPDMKEQIREALQGLMEEIGPRR